MKDRTYIKPNVLFITYDGLLDPLGESQIIPYFEGLRSEFNELCIISFEKPGHNKQKIKKKEDFLRIKKIKWLALSFSNTNNFIFKFIDLLKMYLSAIRITLNSNYQVIHCRSYQAAEVGVFIKKFLPVKVIFDMRGLWVDDRLDGNRWPQEKLFYRLIYKYWKVIERKLFIQSDHIIALTPQTKKIINEITSFNKNNISVIPCCADFKHFKVLDLLEKEQIKKKYKIPRNNLIISYLGSLGTFYLWDDMVDFFKKINKKFPDSIFLVITKHWNNDIQNRLNKSLKKELLNKILFFSASREEVPNLLGISDVMLSFRKNSFSQLACSPTKIGEALACGVPVISNRGVGDIDNILWNLKAGKAIDIYDETDVKNTIKEIPQIIANGGISLRERSRKIYSLDKALSLYKAVYENLN